MYRSFLSWRYLVSRRTNLIGITGIFVAVGALILILSIMTGFLDEARTQVRGSMSDLLVSPIHLPRKSGDGREVPRTPERLLELLAEDERIAAVAPHLTWAGMLTPTGADADLAEAMLGSSQVGDLPLVQLVGIDHEREAVATDFREDLVAEPTLDRIGRPKGKRVEDPDDPFAHPPEYRRRGAPKPVVLVGEQLFHRMQLRRGQLVEIGTIVPTTGQTTTNNGKFVIGGTFRSGANELDGERIYLERAALADLLGDQRQFSEVLVQLHDYDRDAIAVRDDLRHSLALLGLVRGHPNEVRTWEEFNQTLLGAIENERSLMGIMLSLVLMVAGFCIFAILSMMVTEKRRDIGILTALGATRGGVLTVFLLVAFWDALVGTILGTIAGVWMALEIDPIERWLSANFGIQIFNRDVYLFDHIPSRVDPFAVGLIVAGAFLCTLLFAAIPAWNAARTDPLQALRYE